MAANGDLTPKQNLFCEEYLKNKFNGYKAAIAAGYKPKAAMQQAVVLLRNPKVQQRLAKLIGKLSQKNENQIQEIIEELRLLSFSDIRDYVEVDEGGAVRVKTFDQMPKTASRGIKKIRERRTIRESKDGQEAVIVDSVMELELWSKEKALELLGKYEAMFTEKVNHSGHISIPGVSDLSDDDLDAKINSLRNANKK